MRVFGFQGRPGRFRPILTTVVVIVLLTLGWVGLEVWIAYRLAPSVDSNYGKQMNELIASHQRNGGEDAWPLLLEASEIHKTLLESYRTEDGRGWYELGYWYSVIDDEWAHEEASYKYHSNGRPWDEITEEWSLAKRWALDALRNHDELGITELMDRVAASPVAFRPYPDSADVDSLIDTEHGSLLRSLGRGLHASMQRASSRGDWNRYILSTTHLLSLCRHLNSQPNFMDYLVGQAFQTMAFDSLRSDLLLGVPPSEVCELREIVEEQLVAVDIQRLFAGERLVSHDTVQRYYTSSGRFVQTEYDETMLDQRGTHWIRNTSSIWKPRLHDVQFQVDARYEELERALLLPRWERLRLYPYEPPDFTAFHSYEKLIDQVIQPNQVWLWGNIFDMHETRANGVRLMLAIECFAAKRGGYPERLEELVPEYSVELPPDVYSADGSPWIYRLNEKPARNESPYVLYSVGLDGIDDGGHVEPGVEQVRALLSGVFGESRAGIDYVVTHNSDE